MTYEFIDKALYFPEEKILVITDLHLGYEQVLQDSGIFIPRQQFARIKEDLEKIFLQTGKLNEIIILGDLKHEFSRNLQQEWREVIELIEILKKKAEKIIIIKGNHDNYLINVVKSKEKVEFKDYLIIDEVAFIHGNKMFPEVLDKKIKTIFLGHMHAAISIAKNVKKEIYKCFLVGKYKDKKIIILPSFFPLVEGNDVVIENTNLAFKPNLADFEVFVVGDKVYDFGKVKNIGKLV